MDDQPGWGGGTDGEEAAEAGVQARGAGGQSLIGASRVDAQIGEGDGAIAGSGADVQSGRSLQQAARAEVHGHTEAQRQTKSGIVPEGILRLDHRLSSKSGAGRGIARRDEEGESIDGRGADGNGRGGGAGETAAAEEDGDVGGDAVREVGEGDQAVDRHQARRALKGAAAGAAGGVDNGRVIGAAIRAVAHVAKLVLHLNDRLGRKGHPGGGRGRGLGLDHQFAGGTGDFAQCAEVGIGGSAHQTGGAGLFKIAGGQRRAGSGMDAHALPGQRASHAVDTGAADGEDQLRGGH